MVLLTLIGVGAAIARGVFLGDYADRANRVRTQILLGLDLDEPYPLQRAEEVKRFDSRFASRPGVTLVHVISGGLFLTLAPLQFLSWVRTRHVQLHRWSGRALVPVAFFTGLSGLYFGLMTPFGGASEAVAIAAFGGLFLVAVSRAVLAVRRRQLLEHREWMIRAFALALAVSTVRVVGGIFDFTLAPAGLPAPDVFALSIWTGWIVSLSGAEVWIRYTRLPSPTARTSGTATRTLDR